MLIKWFIYLWQKREFRLLLLIVIIITDFWELGIRIVSIYSPVRCCIEKDY